MTARSSWRSTIAVLFFGFDIICSSSAERWSSTPKIYGTRCAWLPLDRVVSTDCSRK
jgi:hypothetical protein